MHSAVLFCLETQYRLLEAAWPKEVLKLPNCREVFAADGSLLFRGPRVRMGIHWAAEGTIAHRSAPGMRTDPGQGTSSPTASDHEHGATMQSAEEALAPAHAAVDLPLHVFCSMN